jgi:hypothetical protein
MANFVTPLYFYQLQLFLLFWMAFHVHVQQQLFASFGINKPTTVFNSVDLRNPFVNTQIPSAFPQ